MSRLYISGLTYEETPPYAPWYKWLLGGISAFTLIIGLSLISVDINGTWFLLGVTAFEALLFYFITPRKYQIFEDKIRIKLGTPFAVNLRFANIKKVAAGTPGSAYIYTGLRLATTTRNVVEIIPKKGRGIVISPRNRDTFLQQVNMAMENYLKIHPDLNR